MLNVFSTRSAVSIKVLLCHAATGSLFPTLSTCRLVCAVPARFLLFDFRVKVLFKGGLCGGDTRSTLHTKLGEQPHQLMLELAEGSTWINEVGTRCGRET